jgi:hypothetical protein
MGLYTRLRPYRWALLGFVVALVAGALLAPAAGGPAYESGLAAAKARWAARPFTRYQLEVQEETDASSCRQTVEVHDEKIARVLANRCVRLPSWTVSNLFTWAEQPSEPSSRCYPSAITCVCLKSYSLRASYDPLLGYPRSITHAWSLSLNWAYLGHWKRLWRTGELPACANVARFVEGHISVSVVALTPIQ